MPCINDDLAPLGETLHELLWEGMQKYGDDVAFVDASGDGKSVTFKEVYQFSRACAAYLQQHGVKKGDFVAVYASGYELLHHFDISRPKMVVVDEARVETMKLVKSEASFIEKIVVIGQSSEFTTVKQMIIEADPASLTKVDIDPENDLAMMPHSSGTTAFPKCVKMTHQNVVESIKVRNASFPKSGSTPLLYCDRPMYNTFALFPIFVSVSSGFKTIIEPEFHLDTMLRDIEKYQVTTALCIPSMLIELANATDNEKYNLASFKVIFSGGAAQSPNVIHRLIEKYGITFVTDYGLTEADSISMGVVLPSNKQMGWCGKIQSGVEVKIVDLTTNQICDAGANGEIRIRSLQAAKGYLKNPSASATAFDDEGWFRTGDIGHLDENGNVVYVDRLKETIKYRALQVSPAELESVIIAHPKVADVGVVGIPDEQYGELPMAFVVPSDSTLTIPDVHEIVNEQLAEYKHLRGGVKFVYSIPRSTMGKIQRKLLQNIPVH